MKLTINILLLLFVLTSYSQCGHNAVLFGSESMSWSKTDQVFVLVRHAEKQKGADPELTEAGEERAKLLAKSLNSFDLKKIYSTDYNRTRATVAPLLAQKEMSLDIYNPSELEAFADELKKNAAGMYVISGHSNTTPDLSNLICQCTDFSDIDESDYTNVYIVVKHGASSSTYQLHY